MQDAWRAYLQLALGLTEASKKRAQKVARKLVGTSGVTAGQVQAFVEELTSTGAANREALTKLIRFEVDRALGAVGLATAEEVADLTARVRELERDLQDAQAATARTAAATAEPLDGVSTPGAAAVLAEPAATAGNTVAKKAVAKKIVAKKAVAKKAVAKSPVAATQATSDQVVATTSPVKKAVAKKAVAKKAVVKKTGGAPAPGRSTPPAPGAQP
jgi:polyhydroxyalkanoate synthesis regulator phasin